MFCTKCGHELSGNDRFCGRCGQARPDGEKASGATSPPPSSPGPATSDDAAAKLTPLQVRRVRSAARDAHREENFDEATRLYERALVNTPRDRALLSALSRARRGKPLREVSGFQALGLTLPAPVLAVVAPFLPEAFFEAWVIIPLVMVSAMLFLYGFALAFRGLFGERGAGNRAAAGVALLVVPATVAGIMLLENRRTDARNERFAAEVRQGVSNAAGQAANEHVRANVDAARARGDFAAALDAALPGARAGDSWLQFVVADIYMNGYGTVDKDAEQAFEWMSRAAAGGEQAAAYNVAYMLETGTGTEPDPVKAFSLYYDLALAGDAPAQNALGLAYTNGTGTDVDHDEAFYWFSRGADGGCAPCMFNLGRAYELGSGVRADREQALHWYTKAAELGHAPSRARVSELE